MMNRLLDLRFVIGLFFVVVGRLLFGYSFLTSKADDALITVNRWTGVVFMLFGLFIIYLHYVAERKEERPQANK